MKPLSTDRPFLITSLTFPIHEVVTLKAATPFHEPPKMLIQDSLCHDKETRGKKNRKGEETHRRTVAESLN
jgi:hypothetical protein